MIRLFLAFAALLVLGTCAADSAESGLPQLMPYVTVMEIVFVTDDGTRDADAFVGPEGATVDSCKKAIPEFLSNWGQDHPTVAFAEAFCVSRPDPAAVLKYHRDNGTIPQAAPKQPERIPGKNEA